MYSKKCIQTEERCDPEQMSRALARAASTNAKKLATITFKGIKASGRWKECIQVRKIKSNGESTEEDEKITAEQAEKSSEKSMRKEGIL